MTYTVIYLARNRFPRQSHKVEIEAKSAEEATFIFINRVEHDNDWIAAVIKGKKELVTSTMEDLK